MATSTEATVRGVIAGAIRGKASELGFQAPDGNVKEYLLAYEQEERKAAYLSAVVDGKQIVWAIGVQVTGNDDWFAMRNITKRAYTIVMQFYREIGRDGSGVNAVIDAARVVRGAIRELTNGLSGTVSLVASTGEPDVSIVDGPEARPGKFIQATMIYKAERVNPDF